MLRPDMSASLPSLLCHLLSFIIYLLLFLTKTKYKRGLCLSRSPAPNTIGSTEEMVNSVKLDGCITVVPPERIPEVGFASCNWEFRA